MKIRSVCAPLSGGKSDHIYREIVDRITQGKQVILIVPEQEAVIAETRLAQLLDGVDSLDLEVLNFKRLCNRVFREYGGISYNQISSGGQAVLFWRVLSELSGILNEITVPERVDEKLVKRFLALYDQFSAFNIGDELLRTCVERLEGRLAVKTEEISAVFSRYKALALENDFDIGDELTRLYDTLCTHDFFTGKYVYFDSFYDFTARELDIVKEVVRTAEETVFTVEYDMTPGAVNYMRPRAMLDSLDAIAHRVGCDNVKTVIPDALTAVNPALAVLRDGLWKYSDTSRKELSECVSIHQSKDAFEECDIAARVAASCVRGGARFREIAVVARNMSDYEGIIDVALQKQGISCHISRRNNLALHPAVRLLFGALEIISRGFRADDVVSYLKTGHFDIPTDALCRFAAYLRLWSIRGKRRYNGYEWNMNPDSHTDIFAPDSASRLDEINQIRKYISEPLFSLQAELEGASDPKATARAIYNFMLGLSLDVKMNNHADHAVWNALIDALDQYAVCAPATTDISTVSSILHMMISTTDIGTIPAHADEVTCGNIDMIRLYGIKHVIVLGASDEVFPKKVRDDGFFTNAEAVKLKKAGIALPDDSAMRRSDERFFFTKALCLGSDTLTICYNGEPSDPTARIAAMLTSAERSDERDLIDGIFTYEDAKKVFSSTTDPTLALAISKAIDIDTSTDAAPRCNIISSANTTLLYPGDLALTTTRLTGFANCPFSFRCNYDLALRGNSDADLLDSEAGTFTHALYERTLKRLFAENTALLDPVLACRIVDEESRDYINRLCGGFDNISALAYSQLEFLTKTTKQIMTCVCNEFNVSGFKPIAFECRVGTRPGDTIPPHMVDIGQGKRAWIYGVIDRIDAMRRGDDMFVRIVDYKSSKKTFNMSKLSEGESLQLPLYLFALVDGGTPDFLKRDGFDGNLIPAGFMYQRVSDPNTVVDYNKMKLIESAEDGDYIKNFIHRSGVILDNEILKKDLKESIGEVKEIKNVTETELEAFKSDIKTAICNISDGILSGNCNIPEKPNERICSYCQYKAICRREG